MKFGNEDATILENLKSLGFDPEVVYDVGASNGSWTSLCHDRFPDASYFLFEPLAQIDPKYRTKLEEIRDSEIECKIFDVVCGKDDHEGTFHQSTYEFGSVGSSSILDGEHEDFEVHPSSIRSLDSLQRQEELPIPDLIKMDIQGAEMEALEGAEDMLDHCTVLFLETWISRGYGERTPLLAELIAWLNTRNFSLFDFGGQYRTGTPPVLISQDVVFVRTNSDLGVKLNLEFHDRKSMADEVRS